MTWTLYILECSDETLYTGITNDFDGRLVKHETGKGAKYTRGRGPFKLVYRETFKDRSKASVREAEIKRLSKLQKLELIAKQ